MILYSQDDAVQQIVHWLITERDDVKGLIPIVGLPRSGKSTFLSKLTDNMNFDNLLIKSGEFDCCCLSSATEDYEHLHSRICNMLSLFTNLHVKPVILIDSIKDIIYEYSFGMRAGGISNNMVKRLNALHVMFRNNDMTCLAVLSTSSFNLSYNQEIASIIAGSCNVLAICRSDYKIALDGLDKRSSIHEIVENLTFAPKFINSEDVRE